MPKKSKKNLIIKERKQKVKKKLTEKINQIMKFIILIP